MYDYIIDSIIDAYEGDDVWAYEDEVRTTINDSEDMGYSDLYRRKTKQDIMTSIGERQKKSSIGKLNNNLQVTYRTPII